MLAVVLNAIGDATLLGVVDVAVLVVRLDGVVGAIISPAELVVIDVVGVASLPAELVVIMPLVVIELLVTAPASPLPAPLSSPLPSSDPVLPFPLSGPVLPLPSSVPELPLPVAEVVAAAALLDDVVPGEVSPPDGGDDDDALLTRIAPQIPVS